MRTKKKELSLWLCLGLLEVGSGVFHTRSKKLNKPEPRKLRQEKRRNACTSRTIAPTVGLQEPPPPSEPR